MTHVNQGDFTYYIWSRINKLTLSSPEHAPAYMMAANAGVIKAIVSFYTALIRIGGIRKT